jgi:uncharacterized protein YfaS (alpha-2-macroglobulin family)
MRVATVAFPTASPAVKITAKGGEAQYSVAVRYRNTIDSLQAESHGIELVQEYLDENGHPKSTFQVGDVVLVRVSTRHANTAHYMMTSSALPAGFEALDERLATVGPAAATKHDWGTYRELRDDRVDFATQYVWSGHYDHEYKMRAIAAGKFVRPPTVATLMYAPEVMAQTAAETIEIVGK